jgi:hypothetical protein
LTIANDIIFLSLRNASVVGVGQTPLPEDTNDAFRILNAMIGMWNIGRGVTVNLRVLPTFPDLTTDVPFWTPNEHVLLTTLAVRLREIYSLPPVELDVKLAMAALETFNAINLQQVAPILPGVPATVQQILVLALRMAGRINDKQSIALGSADMNDAFSLLVAMLAQWRRSPWLAWVNAELIIPSTGAISYPMLDRPPHLTSAFARLLTGQQVGGINNAGPMDYPLAIIGSQGEYNDIGLKQLGTFPAAVWYQPDYPSPSLYFWPIPPKAQFNLHVFYPLPLPAYAAPTDALGLPPEYTSALVANLAVQLVELTTGKDPPRSLKMRAASTLDTVRCSNARVRSLAVPVPGTPSQGSGGISGAVGPHQSVIVLDSGLPVLG